MKLILIVALTAIALALITAGYGALSFEPGLFGGGLTAAVTSVALAGLAIGLVYLRRYLLTEIKCLQCDHDVKRIASLGQLCYPCNKEARRSVVQLEHTLAVLRQRLNDELTAAEQIQQVQIQYQKESAAAKDL